MSIRFPEEDVRDHGPRRRRRLGHHAWSKADAVVAMAIVSADATLLVAGENGIGKRTPFRRIPQAIPRRQRHHHHENQRQDRRRRRRAHRAQNDDEIMLITISGQMVRTRVNDIRETGRNTMGVKLIDLGNRRQTQSHRPRHQRRKGGRQRTLPIVVCCPTDWACLEKTDGKNESYN